MSTACPNPRYELQAHSFRGEPVPVSDLVWISGSNPSTFFFSPEHAFDGRNWLSQTGISWASGALSSWWIRLEPSPVALAILRIDSPA